MALRSLCSLRLPSIVEYVSDPLRKSLTDGNAYVRKTGVMGILKLFVVSPATIKESNLIDLLYNMIQDPDGSVVRYIGLYEELGYFIYYYYAYISLFFRIFIVHANF